MNLEERKARFAVLLKDMLDEYGGIKNKLAESLQIKPSTLTPWIQGKIDPAGLDIVTFERLAKVKGCSVDELAKLLSLKSDVSEKPLDKLRSLVTEMLVGQSQEQLGKKLGISKNTIRGWFNTTKNIDPSLIAAGTIANLASERGWTIERLLAYLGLKKFEETEEDLLSKIQSLAVQLSLPSQVKLQTWVSHQLENKLENLNIPIQTISNKKNLTQKKIVLILEKEDLALASNYANNLGIYFQIKADNIKIATPRSLPDSLSVFDVLLFDLNNQQSPCIPLIESLEFDGDIVAFVDRSLPQDIQDRLKEKVTDVIVKPVPWSELKQKAYFS